MSFIGRTPTNAALTASDLADGIVGTAKIAADAVTAAKIADDVVGTEHLTANEVDTAALKGDAVTGAELADDAVDSEHYTDGSIDTAHIADNQITLAKLAGGTDGNIISFDASGDPVAIATGNDGQVLTSTGAGSPPAFEAAAAGTNTPNFLVHLASNQTLSDATTTLMAFATEVFDSDTAFTPTTTFKFVVPSGKAGVYHFYSQIFFNDAGDNQQFDVYLYKNGSVFASGKERTPGNDQTVEVSAIITLAEGDRVQVYGRHNHGSNLVVDDGTDLTYFYGYKLL